MIPAITVATGTISKSFRRYLKNIINWKARQQEPTEDSHTGQCAHTSECDNAKVQNVYHGKQHYIHYNYIRVTTLYTIEK